MFKKSDKPEAIITQASEGYYILKLGTRELGGTSLDRLKRYARTQGYIVRGTPITQPTKRILSHGF
jgi:hypothetical protein